LTLSETTPPTVRPSRRQAPLGFGATGDERVVDYDEDVLHALDVADDFT